MLHGRSRFAAQQESGMEVEAVGLGGEGQKEESNHGSVKLESFCMLGRVASVFKGLDDMKKGLVRSIGFEGLLKLPTDLTLDDTFSYWLLKNLDTASMSLKTPLGDTIHLKDADAHLVLGIPFIGDQVIDDNQINPGTRSVPKYSSSIVSAVRELLFQNDQDASFTLDYLQEVIQKDYGGSMSDNDKVSFKIAVVLFSMGCFLAVYNKKMAFPIWLLRNFTDPEKIGKFNWSGYVLSVIQHAANEVQRKAESGAKSFKLYGCVFLLQVFYLDNLEIGKLKTLHMDLPRACVFNAEMFGQMLHAERGQHDQMGHVEYGKHKVRSSNEVCYTRGWDEEMLKKWDSGTMDTTGTAEELHRILRSNSPAGLVEALNKLGSDCAMSIKLSYNTLYPGYKPTAEPCESSTSRQLATEVALLSPGVIVSNAVNNTNSSRKRKGGSRMEITSHSNFDESPFDLLYHHPGVLRPKRMLVYNYVTAGRGTIEDLGRYWYNHKVPTPIRLTGLDIKTAFSLNGQFSVTICDALMRAYTYLDSWMYKLNNEHMMHDPEEQHWQWRHFLPASFAKAVLNGEDFIALPEVRGNFIGEHIEYNIADCTLFVVPVFYSGKWSCYFWNFQTRTITVLDPMLMKFNYIKSEYEHAEYVDSLHDALMACIEKFFVGWPVSREGWSRRYPTDLSPRCRLANSGLYVAHYARAFNGEGLCWPLRDNEGYLPEELENELDVNKRHRHRIL